MEEAYEKAQKFINLERELKLTRKESTTILITSKGKQKREIVLKS